MVAHPTQNREGWVRFPYNEIFASLVPQTYTWKEAVRFRDYIAQDQLQEGEVWDALRVGFRAYKKKREEQRRVTEKKVLADKIIAAEGEDLRQLVKQLVDQGLTVQNGKAVEPSRIKKMSKEVLEAHGIHVRLG